MPKSFEYQGEHTDERAIPGVGFVSKGTVITAADDSHAENIRATKLFKSVPTPAPTAVKEEATTSAAVEGTTAAPDSTEKPAEKRGKGA